MSSVVFYEMISGCMNNKLKLFLWVFLAVMEGNV